MRVIRSIFAVLSAVALVMVPAFPAAAAEPLELIVFANLPGDTVTVNVFNNTSAPIEFEVAIDTADLDTKVTDLDVLVLFGTLSAPDAFGIRHWSGTAEPGPQGTQIVQFTFDVIPPAQGVPAVTYSVAVWGESDGIGCEQDLATNCAVSRYFLDPAVLDAGAAALPKTGADPAPIVSAAALAVLLGAISLLAIRQARRAR